MGEDMDRYAAQQRLAELVRDAAGALRVNGLGMIAQRIEEALANMEKDDE